MTEYGIFHPKSDSLHRGPMSKNEAELWIREWEDEGGNPGAFVLVQRTASEWSQSPAPTDAPPLDDTKRALVLRWFAVWALAEDEKDTPMCDLAYQKLYKLFHEND